MFLEVLRSLFGAAEPTPEQLAWSQGPRYAYDRFDPDAVGDDCYVYVHEDDAGRVFYVGKGTGRRAWSGNRDVLWEQFVATRLQDRRYWIRLVATGLGEGEALEVEAETLAQFGDTVVNRQNMSRGLDMEALERHCAGTDEMTLLMARAKAARDPRDRVSLLEQAMELHYTAGQIRFDKGIVAELTSEMGGYGHTRLISELVDAHLVAGSPEDAQAALARYLVAHPREAQLKAIQKLQDKAAKGRVPRKKVHEEAEFIAPLVLPPDWERAEESGRQVIRLRRDLEPVTESDDKRLDAFWRLKSAERFEEALAYAKHWVVTEEKWQSKTDCDRTGVPLSYAIAMAQKSDALLDECLLIQRFIHSGQRDAAVVEEMRLTLRRCAAVLQAPPTAACPLGPGQV